MVKDVVCDPWDDPHELRVMQLPLVGEKHKHRCWRVWETREREKEPHLGFLKQNSVEQEHHTHTGCLLPWRSTWQANRPKVSRITQPKRGELVLSGAGDPQYSFLLPLGKTIQSVCEWVCGEVGRREKDWEYMGDYNILKEAFVFEILQTDQNLQVQVNLL